LSSSLKASQSGGTIRFAGRRYAEPSQNHRGGHHRRACGWSVHLDLPKRPGIDRSASVFDAADFSIRSVGVVRLNPQVARHVAGLAVTRLRILTLS
jgi:hypothetical protein